LFLRQETGFEKYVTKIGSWEPLKVKNSSVHLSAGGSDGFFKQTLNFKKGAAVRY